MASKIASFYLGRNYRTVSFGTPRFAVLFFFEPWAVIRGDVLFATLYYILKGLLFMSYVCFINIIKKMKMKMFDNSYVLFFSHSEKLNGSMFFLKNRGAVTPEPILRPFRQKC